MKKFAVVLLALIFGVVGTVSAEEITEQEVTYSDGETQLKGFYAYPKNASSTLPGVLVVHEWWGHNDYARERTRKLARLGYAALALDMYGEGKTAGHPDKAGEFSSHVKKTAGLMEKRFNAALEYLKAQPQVENNKIAAIGYCFGGGVVLQMAREGVDLDAVVSFHGSLGTDDPAEKGEVKAEVLVLHGAADPFIPADHVAAFNKEMEQAGAKFEFVSYPGVKHSFTNPGADAVAKEFDLPLAYDKEADQDSWAKMQNLFQKVFQQG